MTKDKVVGEFCGRHSPAALVRQEVNMLCRKVPHV